MNVGIGVFGTVQLDNPIDSREIQTTSNNIGSEKDSVLGLRELRRDI
jgi:hypothetical protein